MPRACDYGDAITCTGGGSDLSGLSWAFAGSWAIECVCKMAVTSGPWGPLLHLSNFLGNICQVKAENEVKDVTSHRGHGRYISFYIRFIFSMENFRNDVTFLFS